MKKQKLTSLFVTVVIGLSLAAASAPTTLVWADDAPTAPPTAPPVAPAAPPVAQTSELANKACYELISGLQSGKYQNFIALGDDELKKSVRDTPFDQVTAKYAPRMKKGFETSFFGTLKKEGSEIYFWKLAFRDGGDDVLIQISVKNGKLNRFFVL